MEMLKFLSEHKLFIIIILAPFIFLFFLLLLVTEKAVIAKSHPEEVYNPQPEVNDPPKIENVDVDFAVTEGNLPGIDTDEPRTCARTPVHIKFLVKDPDGDMVTIMVDTTGNDKFNDFKKKTKSGKSVTMKKTFDYAGDYWIKYKACDSKGLCTAVLKFKIKMVLCPPKLLEFRTNTERIGVGDKIYMSFRAQDAQGDKVRYEIDWDDDGIFEQVTNYYPPQKKVTISHAFRESGAHVISGKCCDQLDGCSEVARRMVNVKSLDEE